MTYEPPTHRENQEFDEICEQFGAAGRYKMLMKYNPTNQNPIRTVTVQDCKSGAYEIYNADYPRDSPQYWPRRFSLALAEKTFGNESEEERAGPGIFYSKS
jgi:hypothetical protein